MNNKRIMSVGSLKNNSVRNMEGKDIGHIEEFMIDIGEGSITYAVLSFGGFMGIGDKLFAIPWEALEVDQENEFFRLDVDKRKLENSKGFDKDHWPNFADTTFLHTVNTTFDGTGNFHYRSQ